jgi:hypothetical protein
MCGCVGESEVTYFGPCYVRTVDDVGQRKCPFLVVSSDGKSICLSQKSSWNREMLFAWSCVVEN